MNTKPDLTIYLAAPRGFCAGVDRAIQIVEKALEQYGAPVYVRHEIVHNKFVVDGLREKGAVFVRELDEIPDDGQPVIFSAHGVPKSVPANAEKRNMLYLDATCPLVSKVHREAERHHKNGDQIILIGHAGHPEVIGTIGQLPKGAVVLVETVEDVASLKCHSERSEESSSKSDLSSQAPQDDRKTIKDEAHLAFCTQTTLSVDDTAHIVEALQKRFPMIKPPRKEDICYATTNRQAAVKEISEKSDAMLVLGAPNSSNSNRLVEVAANYGCPRSILVQRAAEIDWANYMDIKTLGITAGASAPEILVEEVIESAKAHFNVTVEEITLTRENVSFKLPKALQKSAAE